jgi:hypothetical protein
MNPNIQKIYDHLNSAIRLAGDITREEGELIFRSNIFQELMFAVNEGDSKKGVKLSEKLERQLGIFEGGADPLAPEGALPLGKGEKSYYVVFVQGDERFGKYASIQEKSIFGAVSKAGERFGWNSWDYLRKEKPEGLEELKIRELQEWSNILDDHASPALNASSLEEEEVMKALNVSVKICEELVYGKVNNKVSTLPLDSARGDKLGSAEALQAPEKSKEERERDLLARAMRNREAYLAMHGLNEDGSVKRG